MKVTTRGRRRGFSLVGMLVTMVCMVILFAIGMNAMNQAVTGGGNAKSGTVRSMKDEMNLRSLFQWLVADSMSREGRFLTPSGLTGDRDPDANTTANLFSALVMQGAISVESCISANERSSWVWADDDYDTTLYRPSAGVYWDPGFVADLDDDSNTSYAHVPLVGRRWKDHWRNELSGSFAIFGNRGPKDGIDDPSSWTYGDEGRWGGHIVYSDGSIKFANSFTPAGAYYEKSGQRIGDNIFAMEDGPLGADSVLAFTKSISRDGPELQYD